MTSCLMIAASAMHLAGAEFELRWQHSVEKTVWRESWAIEEGRLVLTEAAVKGSGAGMEPGDGATLRDGWWVWTPAPMKLEKIVLAASGATEGGWQLCSQDACHEFGAKAIAPLELSVCQQR